MNTVIISTQQTYTKYM